MTPTQHPAKRMDSKEPPTLSEVRRASSLARKTKSGGKNGGRPQSRNKRCPCRLMTVKCAKARSHKCAVAETLEMVEKV